MQALTATALQPSRDALDPGHTSSDERSLDAPGVAVRLLDHLEQQAIPYCVLGDSRLLSEEIQGDLDVMIDPAALAALPGVLARFCSSLRLDLVQCWQHQASCFFYVLSWRDGSDRRSTLGVDVCGDFLRNGRLFLPARELLPDRREDRDSTGAPRGFVVPAPRHGFIYYLLKKVDKQSLNERQAEYLGTVWEEDPAGAAALVRRFWSEPWAAALIQAAQSGRWDEVRAQLPALRAELYRHLPRSARLIGAELRRKVGRWVHPTGLQVVVLGMDGAGKTSVIAELIARGVPGFRQVHYTHFRPNAGSAERDRPAREPHPHPHGAPARGSIGSIAKLLYYAADFAAGYTLRSRRRIVYSGLVLFDRYYDDLLVDPERYRYGGPRAVAQWLGLLVPRPDLVILLDAAPAVVHARKPELPIEEIDRLRTAYLALVGRMRHGRIVDAGRPLELVVGEVEDIIAERGAERTRGRLRFGAGMARGAAGSARPSAEGGLA